MLNQVNLIGNVGNIETRMTQNQLSVTNFSLAVSKKVKDVDHVYWANCVAWGKTSELCQKYVTKGSKLFVTGELLERTWDNKDGVKQFKTEITVKDVIFLTPKNSHDQANSAQVQMFDELPF